ncbi:MAG: hypothetical protein M3178_04820 [Pseudomonadota bacterium]|nr:hypothetical protein [Pseudomonadota bacterium]
MAIATAIVIGNMLYVKDERGRTLFTKSIVGGELMGYTGSSVTIRIGHTAYVFDERGRTTTTTPV